MNSDALLTPKDSLLVNVVRYGAVAIEGYTGPKKVPIIGLDLSNRPEIKELIKIHQETPPGDAITQWGAKKYQKSDLHLLFLFERPSRVNFFIELNLYEHSWLIEGIHQAKIVFLKEGDAEESSYELLDGVKRSISVQIGAEELSIDWRAWRLKYIRKQLQKSGHRRKEALLIAKELACEHENFWSQDFSFDDYGV